MNNQNQHLQLPQCTNQDTCIQNFYRLLLKKEKNTSNTLLQSLIQMENIDYSSFYSNLKLRECLMLTAF